MPPVQNNFGLSNIKGFLLLQAGRLLTVFYAASWYLYAIN